MKSYFDNNSMSDTAEDAREREREDRIIYGHQRDIWISLGFLPEHKRGIWKDYEWDDENICNVLRKTG